MSDSCYRKRRWYFYLNRKGERNLLDGERTLLSERDAIVASNWTGMKRYTVFSNHIQLYKYLFLIPDEQRCFFEILLPHMGRKMYFDIDMDKEELIKVMKDYEEEQFITTVRRAIKKVIPQIMDKGSILVFTSHSKKKLSYHIVIDGWYVQNFEECRVIFDRVLEHIPDEWEPFFDETVYKKTQQFRMIWNHKYEKDNTKTLNEELSYNFKIPDRYSSDKGKDLYTLYSSLVGKTDKCDVLMGFEVEKKVFVPVEGAASEDDLGEVMALFGKDSQYKKGVFDKISVVEEAGNLIIPLKSHGPYECEICDRVHEAENPYLIVKGEEREIYFDCRRSGSLVADVPKRKFIGKLGKVEGTEEQQLSPTDAEGGGGDMIEENKITPPKYEYPVEKVPSGFDVKSGEKKGSSPGRLNNLMGMKKTREVEKPKVNLSLKLRLYK